MCLFLAHLSCFDSVLFRQSRWRHKHSDSVRGWQGVREGGEGGGGRGAANRWDGLVVTKMIHFQPRHMRQLNALWSLPIPNFCLFPWQIPRPHPHHPPPSSPSSLSSPLDSCFSIWPQHQLSNGVNSVPTSWPHPHVVFSSFPAASKALTARNVKFVRSVAVHLRLPPFFFFFFFFCFVSLFVLFWGFGGVGFFSFAFNSGHG